MAALGKTEGQSSAEWSLTDLLLTKLCEKNQQYGNFKSLVIVHIFGSVGTAFTSIFDVAYHLIATIVKLATGILVSPYHFIKERFTKSTELSEWGWTAAISHLAQGVGHFLSLVPLFFQTLLSNPQDVRDTFYDYNVEREKRIAMILP